MNSNKFRLFSQIVFFLLPLTLCLCSSCYYRYVQLQSSTSLVESFCNRAIQIFTVYILFGYTILFVLYWSFMTTASYKLAFIISPFGLPLAVFSVFLYIKSKRLKVEDFQLQSEPNIERNDQQSVNKSRRMVIKDR